MDITIRPAAASDTKACGRIIYEAFECIADRHRFPPDFPTVEAGVQLATSFINHPAILGVVAEYEGRVVGSNLLAPRCRKWVSAYDFILREARWARS